jgi:uncharacterized metal-binding protein
MPELPKKKVGLVSCSGEEMAEGTITRLATLKVLETLRPGETVTICLPLFLAGGEGDRAFAKFHTTIAIDGCEKRCAAKGTERYSSRPAASIVVSELSKGSGGSGTARRLNDNGKEAVDRVAAAIAQNVDRLLGKSAAENRLDPLSVIQGAPAAATCSCGSSIPVRVLEISGRKVEVLALPLIFDMLSKSGKAPGPATSAELMETVRLYNSIPEGEQESWAKVIEREYASHIKREAR